MFLLRDIRPGQSGYDVRLCLDVLAFLVCFFSSLICLLGGIHSHAAHHLRATPPARSYNVIPLWLHLLPHCIFLLLCDRNTHPFSPSLGKSWFVRFALGSLRNCLWRA